MSDERKPSAMDKSIGLSQSKPSAMDGQVGVKQSAPSAISKPVGETRKDDSSSPTRKGVADNYLARRAKAEAKRTAQQAALREAFGRPTRITPRRRDKIDARSKRESDLGDTGTASPRPPSDAVDEGGGGDNGGTTPRYVTNVEWNPDDGKLVITFSDGDESDIAFSDCPA
jgi:hypothetical protein